MQHQVEEQYWERDLALPYHSASCCSRERAMVPLVFLILRVKSSRWQWSDPALLILHHHGYGAATWWEHWKRSLKSALAVSQQVFTSSQLTSMTCCTNTHTPLWTKSSKQTFGSNLSLCDFALRHFKSNYMAGNCLSTGRWQQRAGSSKMWQSHLFSYDNNQGVNYNRLWNRIAIRFNSRWVIVPNPDNTETCTSMISTPCEMSGLKLKASSVDLVISAETRDIPEQAEMDGWLYKVRSCSWMRHKTKALIMASTHQSSYHFYFQRKEHDALFPILSQVIN